VYLPLRARVSRTCVTAHPCHKRNALPKALCFLSSYKFCSQDSSVSTVTRLLAGGPDVESRKCEEIFLFFETSRQPVGAHVASYSVDTGVISGGVKRPEHDVYSHLSSEDVSNEWSHISNPAIRLRGVGRGNCFYLLCEKQFLAV
jgi:hypothetical protein